MDATHNSSLADALGWGWPCEPQSGRVSSSHSSVTDDPPGVPYIPPPVPPSSSGGHHGMLSGSTSHDHLLQGIELHNQNAALRTMEVSRDFAPPNGQRVDMGQIMNVVSENRRMKQLLDFATLSIEQLKDERARLRRQLYAPICFKYNTRRTGLRNDHTQERSAPTHMCGDPDCPFRHVCDCCNGTHSRFECENALARTNKPPREDLDFVYSMVRQLKKERSELRRRLYAPVCFKFNARRLTDRADTQHTHLRHLCLDGPVCPYRHVCDWCGGEHPVFDCENARVAARVCGKAEICFFFNELYLNRTCRHIRDADCDYAHMCSRCGSFEHSRKRCTRTIAEYELMRGEDEV